ncbi:VWA domain-containing protein [soil metagenome]
MIHWVHPSVLLLLLLVPAYLWWEVRGRGAGVSLPRASAFAAARLGLRPGLARVPEILRALAFTLLVVALARPRTAGAVVEDQSEGVPIMIAFDISSSMLAEDFAPRNRLEVARETTREFLAGRQRDPIGLVAFAGEAITQVPLTTDHRVLSAALDNLQIGLLEDGTAIGMGLATAATRLQHIEAEEKVVILMSDGENNRGEVEPLEAAQAAAATGIRVFTVGVGTDEAAPVPLRRGPDGAVLQYAELPVGLDEELLREIATLTGGAYFRADSPDALRRVYRELDRLVTTPVETRRYIDYREWYLLLVVLGSAVLLGEWFLRASRWGRVP